MAPRTVALGLAALLGLAACGDDAAPSGSPDAGGDASAPDAAGPDAEPDAEPDAGELDVGPPPPPPGVPDRYCPGGDGCAAGGDGALEVGAAVADVTPIIDERTDVQLVDVNGNGELDPSDGDTYDDRNGNGVFDGVWMVNSNARAASGVHDPLEARAIVLRDGDTTVALVSVDLYGYFIDQVDAIREALRDDDLDYVLVASTHSHSSRDTLGINGPSLLESGLDPAYMARLRDGVVGAVREAAAALRPVHVQYASLRLRDAPGGMARYVSDLRPPIVIDDEVRALRFVGAADGATVATLINWGQHPECWPGRSHELSADMFHPLRQGVEDGMIGPDGVAVPGVGGVAVVFQGASGANIGPLDVHALDWDGTEHTDRQSELKTEVLGRQVAYAVLGALGPDGGSTTDETATLGFRTRRFLVKLQNRRFHIAWLAGLFGDTRPSYAWDPDRAIVPGRNEPSLESEVAVLDVGRASIVSIPGELDPDLFVGGYDGAYAPEGVEINPAMVNAPDLADAPGPPYLRDLLLEREGAQLAFVFGLSNDQIGYLLPDFNYVLHPTAPYVEEADGEHYDETYSVGIDAWDTVRAQLEPLIRWRPPPGGG